MRLSGACVWSAAFLAFLILGEPGLALADDTIGTSDTVFTSTVVRVPINYTTSYDRDVSTGTWTQSLSYSFNRPRVALSTNGSYSIANQLGLSTQRSGSGSFFGRLDIRATKNWIFTADGRYNKSLIRDPVSESTQRQNRLKLSGTYSAAPSRALHVQGFLYSEFQGDNSLAARPRGRGLAHVLVVRDANGDSIGVDTLLVERDSTLTTGRQDGLTGQADWKPRPWFRMVTSAAGNRIRPTTESHLGGVEPRSTVWQQRLEKTSGSDPNDIYQYETKATYTGPKGLVTWVNLKQSKSDQAYYDRTALNQEHYASNQRTGLLHVEQMPLRNVVLTLDGTLSRSLGEYRLRSNLNNLVSTKASRVSLNFNPSVYSRAALEFDVTFNRNERQQFGNGTNVTRFLQATGAHRLSRRLSIDGAATASLTSFQYVDSTQDQDNTRGYLNAGVGYQVSERCSTQVHFSVNRSHSVAIDPSASPNNNATTTYQMDALMRLGVTSRLSINQSYLLNALYQIYDFASAELRNNLSRIRRIDTVVADSLFPFATLQLNHNFLFRDFGSFSRNAPGADRTYRVFSQTYIQTVSAGLNVKPVSGVVLAAVQGLSNTRIESSAGTTINNHWNLTIGATADRDVFGATHVSGTVQHISAYDELNATTDLPNRDDYWIAGVTLTRTF